MMEPLDVPDHVLQALEAECASVASPRPFAPLAEAYRLAGRPDDALRVSTKGLEAFPDHIAIRLVLARALMDAGQPGAAHEQYRRVLERDPGNQEAEASLGDDEAEATPPDDAEPVSDGGPPSEPGTLSSELQHLSDLFAEPAGSREAPPDSISTLTLAEIYARQGATDRAIEVCEAILRRNPDHREAAARLEEYRRELASLT